LFIDFASGETLHLSGSAAIEWSPRDRPEKTPPGRGIRFTAGDVIHTTAAVTEV
jgi:hypothetical protein